MLRKHVANYDDYGLDHGFALDTSWRRYSRSFTATLTASSVTDGRLQLYLWVTAQVVDTPSCP